MQHMTRHFRTSESRDGRALAAKRGNATFANRPCGSLHVFGATAKVIYP